MRLIATGLLVLLAAGCGKARLEILPTASFEQLALRPSASVTEHVVLVSIDGLRPDAIAAYGAPTLGRLVREGSYTLAATTILPSKTLPSHTSMLTGEPPERHGVLWNTAFRDRPGTVGVPTVFSAARERGYRTAAFFSKSKFTHLQVPGTLDYSLAPRGWFGKWPATTTLADVERHLSAAKPNLLFVHLADPDTAGHAHGWMTAAYGQAVLRADEAVARLMRAADRTFGEGAYILIVTADHGGHGKDHGSDHQFDVTIPWIAWGRGVTPGEIVTSRPVNTMDTASTVLYLLGIAPPPTWQGVPLRTAFAAANDGGQ